MTLSAFVPPPKIFGEPILPVFLLLLLFQWLANFFFRGCAPAKDQRPSKSGQASIEQILNMSIIYFLIKLMNIYLTFFLSWV